MSEFSLFGQLDQVSGSERQAANIRNWQRRSDPAELRIGQ